MPITAAIIVALFAVQRHGTATIGRLFGPVMIAWFVAIGACGVSGIVAHPEILEALSPVYAVKFMVGDFRIAFFSLAGVVLAVTGAEALYADMGHFGRKTITRAWLVVVLPAVVLSYLGQGALVLSDKAAMSAPFFLLTPGWARLPMILLATAATVIASQAVITGAYSLASQAAQLGYLPRLRVVHTSESTFGQIYMPWINGMLMAAVLILVFAFRSSAALAYAYGMAVTGTITITTLLFLYIARTRWRTPLWVIVLGGGVLLLVDLLFVAANLTKLIHGAWLPLLIAVTTFTIMTTWQRGRQIVTGRREQAEGPLREFVDQLPERRPRLVRVTGTTVVLNRGKETAPLAMRANVERNHVLHSTWSSCRSTRGRCPAYPRTSESKSTILAMPTTASFMSRSLRLYGNPRCPWSTGAARSETDRRPDRHRRRFLLLSKIELTMGESPTMAPWRKRLFIATSYLTADAAEFFCLPRDRTVIVGSRIEV